MKAIVPGFGIIDGVFSFLILSASRSILAHAPVKAAPGWHFSQLNGIRPIRVALRLLGLGIGSTFQPNSLVSFRIGKFTVTQPHTLPDYASDRNFSRLIRLSESTLRASDVIYSYVQTEDGFVEVGPNKYALHGTATDGIARKVPVDPNY